jgi:glycosyltransferase involved in cell wall biosynthesis
MSEVNLKSKFEKGNKMKRVCFLLTSLESGGAENYTLRFIRHSADKIQPFIICKSGKKGVLEPQYTEAGATVFVISSGYFNPKAWRQAYQIFKKNKIASVCDFTGNFAGIYLLLAKMAGISTRIAFYRRSSHAFKLTKFSQFYDKIVNKMVQLYATNILANSMHGLNFFHPDRNLSDARFDVIANGVDCSEFISACSKNEIRKELGIPENAFVVGHTGRLNVAKNHPTMLRIAENITEIHDDVYFLFCGKDTEQLMDQTTSEKLKKRLILTGYRTDVSRVLNAIDLYFFPSVTEGQPNALIEAMITGLPFLASNIEPIKEVVPDGQQNCLISPLDVNGFTIKIENAYNDRSLLKPMSCMDDAKKIFSAEKNFNKLLQLL